MTYAPTSLQQARTLLITTIPGLSGAAVGIVGSTGHAATGTSYHLGADQLKKSAYSLVESPRDRSRVSDAAAALDIGEFSFTVRNTINTLRSFSWWLVDQCRRDAPDTRDIREVIWSPDGKTVRRWDRLERRTTGDDSHRWHTHISYFRDSENRDKAGLFRRYLVETGLLEDDVNADEIRAIVREEVRAALRTWTEINPAAADQAAEAANPTFRIGGALRMSEVRAQARQAELLAAIAAAAEPEPPAAAKK